MWLLPWPVPHLWGKLPQENGVRYEMSSVDHPLMLRIQAAEYEISNALHTISVYALSEKCTAFGI